MRSLDEILFITLYHNISIKYIIPSQIISQSYYYLTNYSKYTVVPLHALRRLRLGPRDARTCDLRRTE